MTHSAASVLLSVVLALGVGAGYAGAATMALGDVPRMSTDDLKARLGDPGLVVIDVRQDADWKESAAKIKGAIREDYRSASTWASRYSKDKTIVLYCA